MPGSTRRGNFQSESCTGPGGLEDKKCEWEEDWSLLLAEQMGVNSKKKQG